MLRSSPLRFRKFTAGLIAYDNRIAVSFSLFPDSPAWVGEYVGDFSSLKPYGLACLGGRSVSIPWNMMGESREGYRLVALFNQLPELERTGQLAIILPSHIRYPTFFEDFLESKGIDVEDVSNVMRFIPPYQPSDKVMNELARKAAMSFKRSKPINAFLRWWM